MFIRYNSSSSREHTPELLEALKAYDGELDVVFMHSTSGTAIDQKVMRYAQDYAIEYPIGGYGKVEDIAASEEEASKEASVDPMKARMISGVDSRLRVADDYDALAPDEYAARPLVVLTKGGKYIGIYNPKALTKEFLDSLQ